MITAANRGQLVAAVFGEVDNGLKGIAALGFAPNGNAVVCGDSGGKSQY
jgi:hypothetical protein